MSEDFSTDQFWPAWYQQEIQNCKKKTADYEGAHRVFSSEVLGNYGNILQKYFQYIKRTVKLDEHITNIVFFTALSAYHIDYTNKLTPLNTFLRGPSSTGKTYITTESLKFFPEKDVWKLGSMTPKALIRMKGLLVDENDNPIDLADKPSNRKPHRGRKETNEDYEQKIAQWKQERADWEDRMRGSKHVIDLSGKILVFLEAPDEDTFLILRPVLSHDEKEISFPFVDKSGGSIMTKNVVVRGWCAAIFCTTDCTYLEELSTRSFTASPTATLDKFREGVNLTGEKVSNPLLFDIDGEFDLLSSYIKHLSIESDKTKYRIVNPFAVQFAKAFPAKEARSMRDIQHILALMNVSTMFHYQQRPTLRIDKLHKPFVLVTFKDLEIIFKFLPQVGETTLTGMSQTIIDLFHKTIEPLYKDNGPFTYEELIDKHNEEGHRKLAYGTMRSIVKNLCDSGYLTTLQHPEDKRKKLIKQIKNVENPFVSVVTDFLEMFKETDFKNWVESIKKCVVESDVFLKRKYILDKKTETKIKAKNEGDPIDDAQVNELISQIYKKHYVPSTDFTTHFNNIKEDMEQKNNALNATNLTKNEKQHNSLNLTQYLGVVSGPEKISALVIDYGECVGCGQYASLDHKITNTKNKEVMICEECALTIRKEMIKGQ